MLNRLAARPPTRLPTKRPEPPIVCCNPGNPFGHPIGRLLGGPGVRRCKCAGRRRQAAALVGVAWRCGQRKNRPATHQRPAYLCPATGNRPCLSSQTQRSSPGLAGPGLDLGVHRDFMLTLRM